MPEKYQGADGIRGFACLMVLLAHAPGFFFPSIAIYFSGTGKFGVWLFFVLSAFLLTSKFERNGFGIIQLASYGLGRILRIIPIFALVVIVCFYIGAAGVVTQLDVIRALTFQEGYAHLWTIPVEFKFYFLLPVLSFALISAKRKLGQVGAFAVAVSMILISQLLWPFWLTPENSIFTHWYLASFIVGCYSAVSIDFYRAMISDRVVDLMAGLSVLSIMMLTPYIRNVLFEMPLDGWLQNKFIPLSLIWGVFILAVADGRGVAGKIMKSTIFRKLGAWSFSIYLVHWMVYGVLATQYPNSIVWLVIAVLCSIAAGATMFMLVESNIEKIRHAIQYKLLRPRLVEN